MPIKMVHGLWFVVRGKDKQSTNHQLITNNQTGFALIPLLLILVAATIAGALFYQFIFKKQAEPVVENATPSHSTNLQTQYQNPFDQSSGYTNPFSDTSYSNPFNNLK